MSRSGALGFRCWSVARSARFLLCLLALGNGAVLAGQEAPALQDEPIPTLHVYENLIQIPTLVLGLNRERLKTPIA